MKDNTPIRHPFESCDMIQKIQWNRMQEGEDYHIELILPWKATYRQYMKSGYICFIAKVLKSFKVPESDKGDIILLEFPTRTFERGLWPIKRAVKECFRKTNLGDNNIEMVIKMRNRQGVDIIDIRRTEATPEDLIEANKYYGEKVNEHQTARTIVE